MMVGPAGDTVATEYRFLKFATHQQAEKGLNDSIADGWQLVSYQAAGGAQHRLQVTSVRGAVLPGRVRDVPSPIIS